MTKQPTEERAKELLDEFVVLEGYANWNNATRRYAIEDWINIAGYKIEKFSKFAAEQEQKKIEEAINKFYNKNLEPYKPEYHEQLKNKWLNVGRHEIYSWVLEKQKEIDNCLVCRDGECQACAVRYEFIGREIVERAKKETGK